MRDDKPSMVAQASETVSKSVCARESWHDGSFPGNKLPGYYLKSLRDSRYLSPIGAIESRRVLQRRLPVWYARIRNLVIIARRYGH